MDTRRDVYDKLPDNLILELEAHAHDCYGCEFTRYHIRNPHTLAYALNPSGDKLRNIGGCWLLRDTGINYTLFNKLVEYLKEPGDYIR